MSTDNVTPFPPNDGQPPKPRKRKQQSPIALGFMNADGADTLRVYQGLRGVCNALDTVESRDIDLYTDLSAAAAVLIGILEERWVPG